MKKDEWQNRGAGHRQRLREKFLENGINAFSETEILELILSFGTPRSDCKEPAKSAIRKCGSFSAVLEEPMDNLRQIKGIGPKNAFAIHFIQAAAGYYLKERIKGKRYLHSSSDVLDYLKHSLRGLKKEVFLVIYLDSSHAVIDCEIVAEGTININTIYPRELIKNALHKNSAAMVVSHNHPSGSLLPSAQDMDLTRTLYLLGSLMNIKLLDHIIIGDGSYSFADKGLMSSIEDKCKSALESLHSI